MFFKDNSKLYFTAIVGLCTYQWVLQYFKLLNPKLRLITSWEEKFWAGRTEKRVFWSLLYSATPGFAVSVGCRLSGPKRIPCQLWLRRWQELVLKEGLTHRGEWETSPQLNSYSVKTVSDSWQEFTSWPAWASTVLNHRWCYNVSFVAVCYANSNLPRGIFGPLCWLLRRK